MILGFRVFDLCLGLRLRFIVFGFKVWILEFRVRVLDYVSVF